MCPGEALREWTPVHFLCIVREMWPGFLDQNSLSPERDERLCRHPKMLWSLFRGIDRPC
jgi:hypothetical protein